MTSTAFYSLLKQSFPFTPTQRQDTLLKQLATFVFSTETHHVFLLKGYAGTGKTTIISTLVTYLHKANKKTVLMAPTGRAAKVISNYSKKKAFTIHKSIYFPKKEKNGGVRFVLQSNKHKDTLFIVDEASMISDTPADSKLFENGSLLNDLIQYVYSGVRCKLVLVGDTAQLPPVTLDVSPALDEKILRLSFDKEVSSLELDEVVRQNKHSGILMNATALRELLYNQFYEAFTFNLEDSKDIVRLEDSYAIMDAITDTYNTLEQEDTVIIVRSNKRANAYNQQIRSRILCNDNELSPGDYLMVVKNNYFWLSPQTEAGFIANGDIIEVLELFKIEELYGSRFAQVKVRMIDYPKMPPFETVLILDTLQSETSSMSYEASHRLYQEIMKDYDHESSKYKKFLKVKANKHFNALQVKFSYAITCHKSQGGQWHTVFVEHPYLPEGITKEYLRWLYTAMTRAQKTLYLIGFPDNFFQL